MNKILIIAVLLLIAACQHEQANQYSKADNYFIEALLSKKKLEEKTIVYVLNQSSCVPCEEKVWEFLNINFTSAKKLFVLDSNRKPTKYEKGNYVVINKRVIGKSGMSRAHGVVLVFSEQDCLLIESIDVKNINGVAKKIRKVLN